MKIPSKVVVLPPRSNSKRAEPAPRCEMQDFASACRSRLGLTEVFLRWANPDDEYSAQMMSSRGLPPEAQQAAWGKANAFATALGLSWPKTQNLLVRSSHPSQAIATRAAEHFGCAIEELHFDAEAAQAEVDFNAAFHDEERKWNGRNIPWRYYVRDLRVWPFEVAARLMRGLDPVVYADLTTRPTGFAKWSTETIRDVQNATDVARMVQAAAESQGKLSDTPMGWVTWARPGNKGVPSILRQIEEAWHLAVREGVVAVVSHQPGELREPQRRLQRLRSLDGEAFLIHGKWSFRGFNALEAAEKDRPRNSARAIRSDLKAAAEEEQASKAGGTGSAPAPVWPPRGR